MKKYLSITLYILSYIVILAVLVMGVAILWWKYMKVDFLVKNFNFSSLVGFSLVLLVYGLILKKRKISLIKICNFSLLSVKSFIILAVTGITMGIFTCCVCNTSLVINNLKVLRDYITMVETGNSSFILFLATITIIFVCEEMIFRGTMFNELRRGMPLYLAIFISTALYGYLNSLTQGYVVGTYAYIASIFYTFAYVYTGSLLASITLQIASMYTISIVKRTSAWEGLANSGDTFLMISIILSMLLIFTFYYLMYLDYKKSKTVKKASMSI